MIARRRLGDLEVSALGLGCMGMSTVYGRVDRADAIATVRHALDRGVTLLDTADFYGAGGNERLVGQALRGRRDEAVVATKFGIVPVPVVGLPRGVRAHPDRVRPCAEASLRRLGIDVIDLYYLHRVDPTVPIEDTVGAMADLVGAGLVRHLGLSEASAADLRRAHAVHPIAALESEWSIFSRELEDDALPVARELGVGIVPYSPLGRGMLTGAPEATRKLGLLDYRRLLPRWRGANLDANLRLVGRIRALAGDLGATPAQVALAWLLGRGNDVVPIPGTKRPARIDENLGALDVVLPPEVVAELETMVAAGDRYGERGSQINGTSPLRRA